MRGDYHKIGTLLTNIGTLQRIVAPINLTLAPQGGDQRLQKNKTQNLEARFEIQTYVARAPLPAPVLTKAQTGSGATPPKPGEK